MLGPSSSELPHAFSMRYFREINFQNRIRNIPININHWSFGHSRLTPVIPFSTLMIEGQGRGDRTMQINIIQIIISTLLFFVLFFGIGFIVNMLLRMTWIMTIAYPIVILFVIDDVPMVNYFKDPITSFEKMGDKVLHLQVADVLILLAGLAGTIVSGFVMKALRKRGYRMF